MKNNRRSELGLLQLLRMVVSFFIACRGGGGGEHGGSGAVEKDRRSFASL